MTEYGVWNTSPTAPTSWHANMAIVCGVRSEHDLNELRNDTITPIDIAGTYYSQGGRNM